MLATISHLRRPYGIRPALSDDMRVATVTVGWGDGYPFALSNVGEVLVHGVRCPVLAASANSTMVDAPRVPGVAIGDEVVLLGQQGKHKIEARSLSGAVGGAYRLLAAIPA